MQPVNTRPVGDAGTEVFVPRGGPQTLRRRGGPGAADSGTPSSARSAAGRLSTFREDVGHAAAETYLVTGLAFILLRYLGNFPQGTISDMVADASEGISFICNNAASYGGDPNQIYLMGQSAGAHIAACALVEQAKERIKWRANFLECGSNKSIFWFVWRDPLRGGKDKLVDDVVSVIHADDAIAREKDASTPILERLVYEWQIKLARQISPF
ncbi:hypothetical protein PR202_gb02200 [Eleusine coracana subsp. coracana]|uniref:protein-S-isoprenylcysteine alpha-carbonyl methylesterase n=1 Tax=Eleusine coracana subsp. coracana TaxID=191504 RepID=A0AAV5DYC3_ELECO|nr:hypothetical protein PR202_gb02200 [Eleusine coracana subsp. coracana]